MDELACQWYEVGCTFGWLIDEIKFLFLSVFESILGAFATVVESIPVPGFLQQLAESNLQIPASLVFWTDLFEFPFGLTVLASALGLRFALRRIPFIG